MTAAPEDRTSPEILPEPASTYHLLLDAARAWPDGVATRWIPDPAAYTRSLTWTYAELARLVTRIANALAALGIRRPDAVTLSAPNTAMLYAATLAVQTAGIAAPVNPALSDEHLAGLIRRAQSRVVVTAGPNLDERLWLRMLPVARQAGVTAVLALRPDGAPGGAPPPPTDGAATAGLTVAYLDEVIAGQPSDRLTGHLPAPGDLAAFVHTGGTAGAPKIAAQTHANQLACGRGIAKRSGIAAGEAMLGGLPLEPAAQPKRVYPIEAIPVTAIGKHFKPALAADAAVRAAAEALAYADLPAAQVTAAPENGRLVITVTGADPGRVRESLAEFPLTVRTLP